MYTDMKKCVIKIAVATLECNFISQGKHFQNKILLYLHFDNYECKVLNSGRRQTVRELVNYLVENVHIPWEFPSVQVSHSSLNS